MLRKLLPAYFASNEKTSGRKTRSYPPTNSLNDLILGNRNSRHSSTPFMKASSSPCGEKRHQSARVSTVESLVESLYMSVNFDKDLAERNTGV